MANVKISELAVNSSPSASATLAGVDGGETVQIPISKFVTKDEGGNVTVTGKATVKDGMDVLGESIFRNDIIMQGGGIDVTNAMEIRLWNETDSKNSVLYCSDDGELLLDGKAVAIKDDIPDISNFVTKDENGDIEVHYVTAEDGIDSGGPIIVDNGSSVGFKSEDRSKIVRLSCDDNGKLSLDGKVVATLDDIPSGGLGCTQTPSEGLAFSLMSDGNSYGVSGIGTCADTDIIIPSTYEGKPVTSINLNAFKGCSNLTSIVIPDSVTSIDANVFFNCTNLTSVVIGDSVTAMGSYVFYGCSSLTNIVIPDSVTSIGLSAFLSCNNLTIYCKAESQPSGWDATWNQSHRPVFWGAVTDILDANNKFVTKDENGNVIVTGNLEVKGSAIIEDGVVFNADVEIGTGAYLYLDSEDGSNAISVYCGNDGKLHVDGKEVATVDDIPSGGSPMTSITYAELRALRDAGNLIPGMFYRITDYECTTAQENTRAMNHRFYIIVQALSHDTLSETAKADLVTDGTDDYFVDEGANVSAWEIKYCLDNDTTRFAWADEENGKGVIYYMKDEHGNECPYDFKNIQFKRMVSLENGCPTLDEENGEETWVYTFCGNSYHIDNDEWSELKDGSLENPYGHQSDEDTSTFHNNVIGEYRILYDGENEDYTKCGKLHLSNNVFFGYWEEIGSTDPENYPYYYAYGCMNNKLGTNCFNNTFHWHCSYNTFGICCSNNILGSYCLYNTFGDYCTFNTFKEACSGNHLGYSCSENVFDVGCSDNVLGTSSWGNVFGHSCMDNTFNKACQYTTLGRECTFNTFADTCHDMTFGEYCSRNYFALSCSEAQFNGSGNFVACKLTDGTTLNKSDSFITSV